MENSMEARVSALITALKHYSTLRLNIVKENSFLHFRYMPQFLICVQEK